METDGNGKINSEGIQGAHPEFGVRPLNFFLLLGFWPGSLLFLGGCCFFLCLLFRGWFLPCLCFGVGFCFCFFLGSRAGFGPGRSCGFPGSRRAFLLSRALDLRLPVLFRAALLRSRRFG